jgi:hypothetical protein
MKKQLLLWLLAGMLLPAVSSAQTEIVFETHDKTGQRHKGAEGTNSITFGFASLLNGYTPVYYERKVLSFMSVAIGGGGTMGRTVSTSLRKT